MKHIRDTLVVGSGISGLIAAYSCAKAGQKVSLLERSPTLGGIMQGFTWENTHFDLGCHLIGNDQNETTAIVNEIMDGELSPVDLSVAAIYDGKLTKGFELPDLTTLPDDVKQAFLREAGSTISGPNSLEDWLKARFGQTLFPYLNAIVEKIFLGPAASFAADGYPATPFKRIRLFDDEQALKLKTEAKWDDLLAASPRPTTIPRAFYPKETGISYFIEKARQKLLAMNVEIHTSCQLTDVRKEGDFTLETTTESYRGKQLIWTAGLTSLALNSPLSQHTVKLDTQVHKVPMVLYYYIFPKAAEADIAYLHNFDGGEPIFRMSVPGRYGHKNCAEGESYLCVEVPTTLNSPLWNRPENHMAHFWEKALKWGIIRPRGSYLKAIHKKTPVSYKLPLLGYKQASQPLLDFTAENGIIVGDEWAFTKGKLMSTLLGKLNSRHAA